MRLTLSEALRDDVTALESGVYQLLPHKDLSGRRLLYYAPWRHTREGYDTDSMVRVLRSRLARNTSCFMALLRITNDRNDCHIDTGALVSHGDHLARMS